MNDITPRTFENGYEQHRHYNCGDFYKDTIGDWDNCPCCGLKPKAWVFNNGRFTACGCWRTEYDLFSIRAESVLGVLERANGKDISQYDPDELRKNWNNWCSTGVIRLG